MGTRNYVLILSTSQLSASFSRKLAACCEGPLLDLLSEDGSCPLDGVVAVAHTEAGGCTVPNNFELLLRTLRYYALTFFSN